MPRYVPPARRYRENAAIPSESGQGPTLESSKFSSRAQTGVFSHDEVHKYYWPEWDPHAYLRREAEASYQPQSVHEKSQHSSQSVESSTDDHQDKRDVVSSKEERDSFPNRSTESDNGGFIASQHGTLNNSSSKNEVAYIMLFRGANPRWHTDKIIFVHTNLHLLPDVAAEVRASWQKEFDSGESDGRNFSEQPALNDETKPKAIAVFAQPSHAHNPGNKSSRNFEYIGYHKIAFLERLAPKSMQVIRMLQQKWDLGKKPNSYQNNRRAEAWNTSINQEWAVLKLEFDESANANLPKPDVQQFKDLGATDRCTEKKDSGPEKSVNELLQEMRLGTARTTDVAEASTNLDDGTDRAVDTTAEEEANVTPDTVPGIGSNSQESKE